MNTPPPPLLSSTDLPVRLLSDSVSLWISLSVWATLSAAWNSFTFRVLLVLSPPLYASAPATRDDMAGEEFRSAPPSSRSVARPSPSLRLRKSKMLRRPPEVLARGFRLLFFRPTWVPSLAVLLCVRLWVSSAHWSRDLPLGSTAAITGSTRPSWVLPRPGRTKGVE